MSCGIALAWACALARLDALRDPRRGGAPKLKRDLRAELDDAVGRDVEERGGSLGIAAHETEKLVAPVSHAAAVGREHRLAPEKKRGVLERPAGNVIFFEQRRDVRLLHEAVFGENADEAFLKLLDFDALV